jgi:hypothetical protein
MKIVIATKGRLNPLQRAYALGYRRCLVRMRRELKKMVTEQFAEMQSVVDGIERDHENANGGARSRGALH